MKKEGIASCLRPKEVYTLGLPVLVTSRPAAPASKQAHILKYGLLLQLNLQRNSGTKQRVGDIQPKELGLRCTEAGVTRTRVHARVEDCYHNTTPVPGGVFLQNTEGMFKKKEGARNASCKVLDSRKSCVVSTTSAPVLEAKSLGTFRKSSAPISLFGIAPAKMLAALSVLAPLSAVTSPPMASVLNRAPT